MKNAMFVLVGGEPVLGDAFCTCLFWFVFLCCFFVLRSIIFRGGYLFSCSFLLFLCLSFFSFKQCGLLACVHYVCCAYGAQYDGIAHCNVHSLYF